MAAIISTMRTLSDRASYRIAQKDCVGTVANLLAPYSSCLRATERSPVALASMPSSVLTFRALASPSIPPNASSSATSLCCRQVYKRTQVASMKA